MKSRINMVKIGKAILRQRECVLRKPQSEIEKNARMSSKTLCDLERGKSLDARIGTLDRVAMALGWSLIELLQASNRESD